MATAKSSKSSKSSKERAMFSAYQKEANAAEGPHIRKAGPGAAKKANDAALKVLKKYRAKAKKAGLRHSLFNDK